MPIEEGNNDILDKIDETDDNSISQEELNKALNEGMFDKEEDVRWVSEALKNDQNELAQSLKSSLNTTVDEILNNPNGITEDSKKILKLWCSLIGESDQEKYGKVEEILRSLEKVAPTEKDDNLGSEGGGEHQGENVEKFSNDDIKTAEGELQKILIKIKQRNKDFLWSNLQTNKDAIKYIQILLKVNGCEVNQYEGDFDESTKDAIIQFQKNHKPLGIDGKVGRFTLEALLNSKKTKDALSDRNDDRSRSNEGEENAEVNENVYGNMDDINRIGIGRISPKIIENSEQKDDSGKRFFRYGGVDFKKINKGESGVGYRKYNTKLGIAYVLGNFENNNIDNGLFVTKERTYRGGLNEKLYFNGRGELFDKNSKNYYSNAVFVNGYIKRGTVKFGGNSEFIKYTGQFKDWNPCGAGGRVRTRGGNKDGYLCDVDENHRWNIRS